MIVQTNETNGTERTLPPSAAEPLKPQPEPQAKPRGKRERKDSQDAPPRIPSEDMLAQYTQMKAESSPEQLKERGYDEQLAARALALG